MIAGLIAMLICCFIILVIVILIYMYVEKNYQTEINSYINGTDANAEKFTSNPWKTFTGMFSFRRYTPINTKPKKVTIPVKTTTPVTKTPVTKTPVTPVPASIITTEMPESVEAEAPITEQTTQLTVPIQPVQSMQSPTAAITTTNMTVLNTEEDNTDADAWVAQHNRVRATVGQKPVKWNPTLAAGAKAYAQKCVFAHSKQTDRTYNNGILGENLAQGSPYNVYTNDALFKLWENEKEFYTYPQGPSQSKSGETGHYTQIVNSNVTEIGCGCAKCGTGNNTNNYCVCRYNPIQITGKAPY